jgi:hypothetical protein
MVLYSHQLPLTSNNTPTTPTTAAFLKKKLKNNNFMIDHYLMFILRVHFGNAVVYAFSKSEATKVYLEM